VTPSTRTLIREPYEVLADLDPLQDRIAALMAKCRMWADRQSRSPTPHRAGKLRAALDTLSDLEEDEAWFLWELRRQGFYSRYRIRLNFRRRVWGGDGAAVA
jgi:hypothetical protein